MGQSNKILFVQKFCLIILLMFTTSACVKDVIDDNQCNTKNDQIMVEVWYEDENKHLIHDKEANIYLYHEFDFIYQQSKYEWDGVFESRGVKYLPTECLRVDDNNCIYVDQDKYKRFLLVIECRYKERISTYYKLGIDPMQKLSVTFK